MLSTPPLSARRVEIGKRGVIKRFPAVGTVSGKSYLVAIKAASKSRHSCTRKERIGLRL